MLQNTKDQFIITIRMADQIIKYYNLHEKGVSFHFISIDSNSRGHTIWNLIHTELIN